MKVFMLAIVMLTLSIYVTGSTSLDSEKNVKIDEAESKSDDARTKRSGEIFSSLLKKKLALLSQLTGGASSGKSIGLFGSGGFQPFPEQYEEPLTYHTKSFNLWGVKKAILSSVLQAAKAITGGVIALKGNLITAKGHVVVAKGKLMQTKGQAITSFGKTIATHAFDSQNESPSYEQGVGLFNHLPAVPIHQPNSYGAATAFGFQQQTYPGRVSVSHAYPSGNGYQVAAPSQFSGYAVPQAEYGGGFDNNYPAYGAGAGLSAKRAVFGNAAAQESVKNDFDKDAIKAGLLFFKPIKMPQTLPLSAAAALSVRGGQQQHPVAGQRPLQPIDAFPLASSLKTGIQSAFNRFQAASLANSGGNHQAPPPTGNGGYQQSAPVAGGFQTAPQTYASGYSPFLQDVAAGYPGQSAEYNRFPANGGGSVENGPPGQGYAHPNFAEFPQVPGSQELDRQHSEYPDPRPQQERQPAFDSRENFGGDQHESASASEEHVVEPVYKHSRYRAHPKPVESQASDEAGSRFPGPVYFQPTTAASYPYGGEGPGAEYPRVRSAADDHGLSTRSASPASSRDSAVPSPLRYHNDTSEEEQARLKETVHRFFAMLKKQS